jgi:glucose-6-phosphate dehydrogenase assembly protein OpcA
MEDVVSEVLEQRGRDVSFSEIESVLARGTQTTGATGHARALTATVVAIGPDERAREALPPLQQLCDGCAVRAILVTQAPTSSTPKLVGNVVVIGGLPDRYVDNALAALRLSSLPTLVWWRGGSADMLASLAKLADRVVLDADPAPAVWQRALELVEQSAFSDLRWTRLTRWRALVAQFVDVPDVRDAIASFNQLRVEGADHASCSLLAAWVRTALHWKDAATIQILETTRDAAIESINLGGDRTELALRLASSRRCVEASASVDGRTLMSRVVSLGNESLTGLLSEELRIRSRDDAFEAALRGAVAHYEHVSTEHRAP